MAETTVLPQLLNDALVSSTEVKDALLDLPAELLLEILDNLDLSSIIRFSRTSKLAFNVSRTTLNHYLNLDDKFLISQHQPTHNLAAVRFLRIRHHVSNGSWEAGYAWLNAMKSSPLAITLPSFKNLTELVTTGPLTLGTWNDLDRIARPLGSTSLRVMDITVAIGDSDMSDEMAELGLNETVKGSLPTLTSLRLTVVGPGLTPRSLSKLLPGIAARFPNLVHLHFYFSLLPSSSFYLFNSCLNDDESKPIFPKLKTLNITIPDSYLWCYYLEPKDLRAHMQFLHDHPQLEEFSLPPCYLEPGDFVRSESHISTFERPPLPHLQYLSSSLTLVLFLASSFTTDSPCRITELRIDRLLVSPQFTFNPFSASHPPRFDLFPFQDVRILTLTYGPYHDSPHDEYKTIPNYFPLLEELHLEFYRCSAHKAKTNVDEWEAAKESFATSLSTLKTVSIKIRSHVAGEVFEVDRNNGEKVSFRAIGDPSRISLWERRHPNRWV